MKRIMVRLDDDLYTRIFETAHDQRVSMNAWIVGMLTEQTEADGRRIYGEQWQQ